MPTQRKRDRSPDSCVNNESASNTTNAHSEPSTSEGADSEEKSNNNSATLTTPSEEGTTLVEESGEGSSSEAPPVKVKLRRISGLSKTIEMLKQSQLWMGHVSLENVSFEPDDATMRITRRMAATSHPKATLSKDFRSLQATTKKQGSVVGVQQDAEPTTDHGASRPSDDGSKQFTTAEEIQHPASVSEPGESSVTGMAAHSQPTTEGAVGTQETQKSQKSKQKQQRCADLHVDHSFFDRLRFIPLISQKAPVAQESDVLRSSSHCQPHALRIFTEVLLKYAPEIIFEAAKPQ